MQIQIEANPGDTAVSEVSVMMIVIMRMKMMVMMIVTIDDQLPIVILMIEKQIRDT